MKTLTIVIVCALFAVASTNVSGGGGDSPCLAKWCSKMYTYQKRRCEQTPIGLPSCYYTDTSYDWCVQKWGSQPSSSYGEIEVWDDDRIKEKSGTLKSQRCRDRSGSGGGCDWHTIQLDGSEAFQC